MLLDEIKELIGISDDSQDSKLELYIKIATQAIKNYLNNYNIDENYVKENYSGAVIMMVNNAYKSLKDNSNGNVKSMTQGNRSITYFDENSTFTIDKTVKSLLPAPYVRLDY